MAQPAWLNKYLTMKPEIQKIFDDLDEWLDHCRFNLLKYDPADLYKSDAYKEFARRKNGKSWHRNGERKPYLGKNPRPHYNNNRH